jgi:hypothetical protein
MSRRKQQKRLPARLSPVLPAAHPRIGLKWTAIVSGIFLVSRLALLSAFNQSVTDLNVYGNYASEFEQAAHYHLPFYQYHEAKIQWIIDHADSLGIQRPDAWQKAIAYPPLALLWMRVPGLFTDIHAVGSDASLSGYRAVMRIMLFVFDAGGFIILMVFLSKIFPEIPPGRKIIAGFAYCFAGLCLPFCLYERMDIVTGMLIAGSFLLLAANIHYAWSFAVLAIAINFRIAPIVLAPVWIAGSLPCGLLPSGKKTTTMLAASLVPLAARAAWMAGLCAAMFFPFYLMDGASSLKFLSALGARAIQIESTFGWLTGLLKRVPGQQANVFYAYGCWNIGSGLTPILMTVSRILIPAAIAFAGLTALAMSLRSYDPASSPPRIRSCARDNPMPFMLLTLATLAVLISVSSIFSPQYLLWLLPMVPCMLQVNRQGAAIIWIFIAICIFTSIIYPPLYAEILGPTSAADGTMQYAGPSALGSALLTIRNGLIIALAVLLILNMKREISRA